MRFLLILVVVVGLAAGGAAYYAKQLTADPPTEFRTVAVEKGDVASTITATGTLEPEEVVDVGAQVAGLITKFAPDKKSPSGEIDWGSIVKENQKLAFIDPRMYQAQADQAEAMWKRSVADLGELKAKLVQTEKELKRAERLLPQKAIADTDYDLDVANRDVAKALVEVGKATIAQNKAAWDTARTNLEYTTITSPVNGVVIDRRVNIGQTVVAALSAPSLFLIAKDLSKMQVWASVNEADIGHIHIGMPVDFTVDAFSGENFHGHVLQIRLNAQMTQNVVTYTVVVWTPNKDLRLLPYLTANLRFLVDTRHNVLRVPNVALRWKPRPAQIAPQFRKAALAEEAADDEKQKPAGEEPPEPAKPVKTAKSAKTVKLAKKPEAEIGCLWVEEGDFVRPVKVQIGITDGSVTEISGPEVKEGMEAVIGEARPTDADNGETTNPFLPKIRRGKKK